MRIVVIRQGDDVFVASCNSVLVVCFPRGCSREDMLGPARLILSDEELQQLAQRLDVRDETP